MKQILMIIALCLVTGAVFGQEDPKDDFRYNPKGLKKFAAFGAPLLEVSFQDGRANDASLALGLGGGMIYKNRFYAGAYFQYQMSDRYWARLEPVNDFASAHLWHMGVWLGGSVFVKKRIHPTVSLKMGGGEAKWIREGRSLNENDPNLRMRSNIFVLTPQVGMEANIYGCCVASVEIGNRIVTMLKLSEIDATGLNNPLISLTLKWGGF